MKVIVTGGREFNNEEFVKKILNDFHSKNCITELAQGGARGVDTIAARWAKDLGIPIKTYYADWNRYGHLAGPLRNEEMANDFKPDIVLAFPGEKGTRNMIKIASKLKIEIIQYDCLSKNPN